MSDTINFPYYPSSNRTYGVFADVDGSKANTAQTQTRAILVGQMLAGGTAVPNQPVLVTSLAQVGLLTVVGSMIYEMVKQYRVSDTFGELWILPLADPLGGAATGSLALAASTSLGTGIMALYIGGVSLPVPVVLGDTAATIAIRTAALIAQTPDCPVNATAVAGLLSFTAKHVGLLGNDIDIELNYLGPLGGEYPVTGLTATITPMANGAGVPIMTTAQSNLADVPYDFIGMPYTDSASLTAWDLFFNFATGRWSWNSMIYGGYFTAARGTPGSLVTLGLSRDGPNGSCLGIYGTPDPMWVVTAELTAQYATSLRVDPNVPLQNIVLNIHAPARTSAFTRSIRNTLLYSGISTFTVNAAGQAVIERAVTFYQTNAAGTPDNAYLDVETMYGLMLLIRGWQQEILRLFPRSKLFQDGNPIPAGASATTAQQIGLATVAWYRNECANGNAQNPDQFAAKILSQNAGNGLVKELLPFFVPNQLREIAGLVQFLKP